MSHTDNRRIKPAATFSTAAIYDIKYISVQGSPGAPRVKGVPYRLGSSERSDPGLNPVRGPLLLVRPSYLLGVGKNYRFCDASRSSLERFCLDADKLII